MKLLRHWNSRDELSQNWNSEVFELTTDRTFRNFAAASQEVYRKDLQSTLFSYIFISFIAFILYELDSLNLFTAPLGTSIPPTKWACLVLWPDLNLSGKSYRFRQSSKKEDVG